MRDDRNALFLMNTNNHRFLSERANRTTEQQNKWQAGVLFYVRLAFFLGLFESAVAAGFCVLMILGGLS